MCFAHIYPSNSSYMLIVHKDFFPKICFSSCYRITIETVAVLSEKAGNTIAELNATPTTTLQFVNYFHYLDNCQDKIQKLFSDIDFANEYFDLMVEFDILIDAAEKDVFQGR